MNKMNLKTIAIILSSICILSMFNGCDEMETSRSWAKNKFKEETGLKEGCEIDNIKTDGNQVCIYATITNEARREITKKLHFVSNIEFLKQYYNKSKGPMFINFSLYNLGLASDTNLYYLKYYTNSSGAIATSYYVTILSKKENKIIFTEAFYDL